MTVAVRNNSNYSNYSNYSSYSDRNSVIIIDSNVI